MVRNEKEGRDALREGNTSMGHARIENRFVDLTILSRCPPFGFSLERIGHPAMGRDGYSNYAFVRKFTRARYVVTRASVYVNMFGQRIVKRNQRYFPRL